MAVSLNAFRIELSSDRFSLRVLPMPVPGELKEFRRSYGHEWFLHWRDGTTFAIPRAAEPGTLIGEPGTFTTDDHLARQILAARLTDVLPDLLPKYEPVRRHPFSFLAQHKELVAASTEGWCGVPPLVSSFQMRPRFELDPRIVETRNGETCLALVMHIGMHWSVSADLRDLQHAGIDIAGLHVVRRNPEPDQRRLVGRVARLSGDLIHLAESFDDAETIAADHVWLEGTPATFVRCLGTLLGSRYKAFEERRVAAEGEFLLGPALHRHLNTLEQVLKKKPPVALTSDLWCSFGSRITFTNDKDYTSLVTGAQVEYCFDAAKSKRHRFAWVGLQKYGPYSRDTFGTRTPRILLVTPDTAAGKVSQFAKVLRDGIQTIGDSRYPRGLATFGLVNPAFAECRVPMLAPGTAPPSELYRRAVEEHLAGERDDCDVAIVAILDEHSRLPDESNPYLHAKAALLLNGIPVQEARLSSLTRPHESLQYIIQNLAVALYAKMGGVPWTVAHDLTVDDELVIGMGAAELSGSRFEQRQRFIGITTVFRGDGNFLLSNVSKVCGYDNYPATLQDSTLAVLQDVKKRNGWRPGDTVRVVFHIHKPLKNVEVAAVASECVQEIGNEQNVQFAFLTVSQDHPFKLLDTAQRGAGKRGALKGEFAPERGTIAQLGRFTRLLATNGPSQIKRATTPLPTPLLIHLHPESSYRDLTYLTEQVLKFTSLTWRSTQPAAKPVTIYYSELIAGLLARLQGVPGWSPAVLNSKLRASRWFL